MTTLSVLLGLNFPEMEEEPAPPPPPKPKETQPPPPKEEDLPENKQLVNQFAFYIYIEFLDTSVQSDYCLLKVFFPQRINSFFLWQALKEKELGNSAYKNKDFETALKHYEGAIKHDPTNMTYISNKAGKHPNTMCHSACQLVN